MSTWIVPVCLLAFAYVFTAAMVLLLGFINYTVEREFSPGDTRGRTKAARQIKYAIVWPVLIPKSAPGHFFEDLRRDMRGGK